MPVGGLDRTPSHQHTRFVTSGAWCFEREFGGCEERPPIKIVAFDCDETLTLSTFMPRDADFRTKIGWSESPEYITQVNFESPLVEGSRVERLQALLEAIKPGRALVVLTRNEAGAVAVLNLLLMAGLGDYFDAIWSMTNSKYPRGAYKHGGTWKVFTPPVTKYQHKADLMHGVCEEYQQWFPQAATGDDSARWEAFLRGVRPEHFALVDDVRTNFQSSRYVDRRVVRYCKVARYDCEYRNMGTVRDMGGLGARSLADFENLQNFVESPWKFRAAIKLQCVERPFEGADEMPPVSLVIFDFDATLSLYTFMPVDDICAVQIGVKLSPDDAKRYVQLNFDSPFVEGDRVAKLRKLLRALESDGEKKRTLAVLTQNEDGAVAVLNLLLLAGLADHFSAIWTSGTDENFPNGVYNDHGTWKEFRPPIVSEDVPIHFKVDVVHSIVENPTDWFPLLKGSGQEYQDLRELRLENVVLIDDDRRSFECAEERSILRTCKVAHYDEVYRDQGLLIHMGGIGAKNDSDFQTLQNFVNAPWEFQPKLSNLKLAKRHSFMLGSIGSSGFATPNEHTDTEALALIREKTGYDDEKDNRHQYRSRRTRTGSSFYCASPPP